MTPGTEQRPVDATSQFLASQPTNSLLNAFDPSGGRPASACPASCCSTCTAQPGTGPRGPACRSAAQRRGASATVGLLEGAWGARAGERRRPGEGGGVGLQQGMTDGGGGGGLISLAAPLQLCSPPPFPFAALVGAFKNILADPVSGGGGVRLSDPGSPTCGGYPGMTVSNYRGVDQCS